MSEFDTPLGTGEPVEIIPRPGTELVLRHLHEVGTIRSARHWELNAAEWAWRIVDWGTDEWDRNRGHISLEGAWDQFQASRKWAAWDRQVATRMEAI